MNWRKANLIIILVSFFLIISGCSQAKQVTFDQLPLYTGTKPISEDDVLAQPLAESLKQSASLDDMQAEMQVFNLTGDSSWQRMDNFYDAAMKEFNWERSDDYGRELNYVNVSGWTRGGWSEEQVLIVSRMDDPFGGSPYLILILFTK